MSLFKLVKSDDPEHSAVALWQSCVTPEIRRTDEIYLTLAEMPSPYRLMLDFSDTEAGTDIFIVRVQLLLRGSWKLSEWYRVEKGTIRSDLPMELTVNGGSIGNYSPLLTIEPLFGPWHAKIEIAQTSGTPKTVWYMVI